MRLSAEREARIRRDFAEDGHLYSSVAELFAELDAVREQLKQAEEEIEALQTILRIAASDAVNKAKL